MGHPRPLFNLFSSFQKHITICATKKCEKCPSSILCQDSNSLPLKHESPPITTRPELPPTKNKCESLFQLDIFHEDDIILHSIFFVGWLSLWLWPAGIPQSKLPRQQLLCHEQQVLIRFRDLFASFCASEITKMQQNRKATMQWQCILKCVYELRIVNVPTQASLFTVVLLMHKFYRLYWDSNSDSQRRNWALCSNWVNCNTNHRV